MTLATQASGLKGTGIGLPKCVVDPRGTIHRGRTPRSCSRLEPPLDVELPACPGDRLVERLGAFRPPQLGILHAIHVPVSSRISGGVYLCPVERELGREVGAA